MTHQRQIRKRINPSERSNWCYNRASTTDAKGGGTPVGEFPTLPNSSGKKGGLAFTKDKFVVHFADAQTGPVPIPFGVGLGGFRTNLPSANLNLLVARTGTDPAADKTSRPEVLVYQSCWENTWPIAELESNDLISTMTEAAPFLE